MAKGARSVRSISWRRPSAERDWSLILLSVRSLATFFKLGANGFNGVRLLVELPGGFTTLLSPSKERWPLLLLFRVALNHLILERYFHLFKVSRLNNHLLLLWKEHDLSLGTNHAVIE